MSTPPCPPREAEAGTDFMELTVFWSGVVSTGKGVSSAGRTVNCGDVGQATDAGEAHVSDKNLIGVGVVEGKAHPTHLSQIRAGEGGQRNSGSNHHRVRKTSGTPDE